MRTLAFAAMLLAAPAVAQTVPETPRPIAASKIILVGDSTTAVIGGWGPSFCAYHVTSFAACVNLARGGRSSGSYRAEGSWDLALAEMRTPGYKNVWVLIQFGHNDQPGKPGRSTDLATEFPANMARYVDEVRAAGAKPVLLTPLTRRIFKDGKLQNDLEPWAAAIRKVAAEKKVPLLDLNAEGWLAAKGHTRVTLPASFWPAVFLRRQSRMVWTRQRYTPAFARAG
jgi:lysophospholipase L1-like esterase